MGKVVNLDTEAETLKRIERYAFNPPENSRVFTITPGIAEHLLGKYNLGNRSKKPGKIAQYAKDMAAKQWFLTGDSLKFSDEGLLRDGQNRLAACVRAGVAFSTHVVFGIPAAAFVFLDRGRPRDGSDALTVAAYSNAKALAAAVRWAYLLDTNPLKRIVLEPQTTLRLIKERYSTIENSLPAARAVFRVYGHPLGQLTALHYHFARKDRAAADEFYEAWARGQLRGRFRSIDHLQARITTIKAASYGRIHDGVRCALIIKAWNCMRQRKAGSKRAVDYELQEPFPEIL